MLLPDVNVLIYAFEETATDHARYRSWLTDVLHGDEPVGVSDVVLSAFVRIVTHPRILTNPATLDLALEFVGAVRAAPSAVPIAPGGQHWAIFERTCRAAGVRGNLIPDAFLAALAMEHGATLVTTDRDFSRFAGLRVRHPLAPPTTRP